MKTQIMTWLSQDVFPLWLARGVDVERGGFIENLSSDGVPRLDPRRSMVQARQLFAFRTGIEMGVVDRAQALQVIDNGTTALVRNYSHSSGLFLHSVDENGRVLKATPELYTQAFVLFGLAQSYSMLKRPEWKARALELVAYLERERRVPVGGFTELGDGGRVLYQSNPHMHLFEAALAWREIDEDPTWVRLSDSIAALCRESFTDAATGVVAEHFSETWRPVLEGGRFVFEPGHQYEWSWLLGRHQKMAAEDHTEARLRLFTRSEAHGIDPLRRAVWDQLWSDYQPKQRSARFWPQTERIKAAVQLEKDALVPRGVGRAAADEGMTVLFKYLRTPVAGLWYDKMDESGDFTPGVVKASSLYHIIGSMSEYRKI